MRGYRVPALLAVGGLLLLAVVSARGSSAVPTAPAPDPDRFIPADIPRDSQPPGSSGVPVPDAVGAVSAVLVVVAMVIVAALVLTAVLLLLRARTLRRDRRTADGSETEEVLGNPLPDRLATAAARAMAELTARTGGPPGDAVIAAWLTLEDAAAHEGAARAPHQTSTEFTAALLGRHTTDEAALGELRSLYQRARFGPTGTIDERDVDAATAALDRVLRGMRDLPAPT